MTKEVIKNLPNIPSDKQFLFLFGRVSEELLKIYRQTDQELVIKSDNSPQTIADRFSHTQITSFLKTNTPYPVFSEEVETPPVIMDEFFWTLDPLDGTKDFINKTDEFSIMAALIQGNKPIFGVVYQPVTGVMYIAEKGKGAHLVEKDGSVSRLRVSTNTELNKTRMIVSRSHAQKTDQDVASALGAKEMIPHGSFGLKIGLMAQGKAELLLYPPKVTSIWDSAPNIIIISEAGGKITDLDGKDLIVDPSSPRNQRGIIASNGFIHDELLSIVRKTVSY